MKDIKNYWIEKRNSFAEMAERTKESQSVSFNLLDEYDKLTYDEKLVVHEVLSEWLVSDDNTLRYDAGFLISQRNIRSLKNAVEDAIIAANKRNSPEAKFEIKKLNRILKELTEQSFQ